MPRDPSAVSGKAYSPSAADWTGPWREIHFVSEQPIRLVYCCGGVEGGGGFALYASGDADGDGRWSVYSRQGRIIDGSVVIGPIAEGLPSPVASAEPKSRCEGMEDCRNRCETGSAWACQRYGLLLRNIGDRDGAEAAYRKSCDAGFGFGCLGLGILLEELRRLADAKEAYRGGCDASDPHACRNLGSLLDRTDGQGSGTDRLSRACEFGDLEACPVVLRRRWDHEGPARAEPTARRWSEAAPADGCYWLAGCLHQMGRNEESAAVLRRACEAGDRRACDRLTSEPPVDSR